MSIQAKNIAAFLDAELNGPDVTVLKPSSLASISPGSLVFAVKFGDEVLDKLKDRDDVLALVVPEYEARLDCPHVVVSAPRLAFARVVREFFVKRPTAGIAGTAVIGQGVKLGEGVIVGEFSVIADNVDVGAGTEIRHHVVIEKNTLIGASCFVGSHSVIGEEGVGVTVDDPDAPPELIPQLGNVVIGDNVRMGTFTTINRGTLDSTVVGDNVAIGHHVNVGHNVTIHENAIITSCVVLGGSARIGKGAWIGLNASVREYANVGDKSKVGMGAVVVKDVPENKIVVGSPARVLSDRIKA